MSPLFRSSSLLLVVACGGPLPIPGPDDVDGGRKVESDAGSRDAGARDAGLPPPDYCTEIRPILQLNCVATCHGEQMGYPGSPTGFRLDYYESKDGGLPGVKAMALRIHASAVLERTQPPADFGIFPSAAELALLNRWILAGAPAGDGGCE